MAAITLPPDDASMGVGPTMAKLLRRATTQATAMSATRVLPASRYAIWRSLETQVDRWASYGALALGVSALVVSFVVF